MKASWRPHLGQRHNFALLSFFCRHQTPLLQPLSQGASSCSSSRGLHHTLHSPLPIHGFQQQQGDVLAKQRKFQAAAPPSPSSSTPSHRSSVVAAAAPGAGAMPADGAGDGPSWGPASAAPALAGEGIPHRWKVVIMMAVSVCPDGTDTGLLL